MSGALLQTQEVLQDVTIIESSLNGLLERNVPNSPPRSLDSYQGPCVPMPSFRNELCVVSQPPPEKCKPVFELGFFVESSDDESAAGATMTTTSVSSDKSSCDKVLNQEKVSKKPTRTYHHPREESQMESLANKKFSPETQKKIHWVLNMYHQWRTEHNKSLDLIHIFTDLDKLSTIEKSTLSYGLCQFITEVKKINGDDFPPKMTIS